MAKLEILQVGAPVLREKCVKVENIDLNLLKLLDDMKQTLEEAQGAGLAGPQVGKNIRVFIVSTDDGYFEFINPRILGVSGSQYGVEGCLSVKGKWGDVKRPKKLRLKRQTDTERNSNSWQEISRRGLSAMKTTISTEFCISTKRII